MELSSKIYVAGHRGMAGSAVMKRLETSGFTNFVTRTRAELDLTNQAATRSFFKSKRLDTVVLAAAKVGSILANSTYSAGFSFDNLQIQTNVIEAA
jgi:GDP-L-fucose synthase